MLHVSTRGEAPALGFADALLTGLARDGGLYLPEAWPALTADTIRGFAGQPYAQVAKAVLGPLVDGDIPEADARAHDRRILRLVPASRPSARWRRSATTCSCSSSSTARPSPSRTWRCSSSGRLMDHVLKARGARATIVGATSGDTGSAAVEAFKGLDQVDIFILYPHGRVSDVQRRQMTTIASPNVHALAVEGTFDDCQTMVKGMFNHARFRDELQLSGVNSINWARVAAQAVYYFTAAVALGSPHRPVSFSVPTGNFGDILAGLRRQAHGPADRAADDRHQRQRHSGPHPRLGHLRDQGRRSPPPRPRWTSRSRPISSACCSRPTAATARRSAGSWQASTSRAPSPSMRSRSRASARTSRRRPWTKTMSSRRWPRPTAAPAMCSIRTAPSAPAPAARC